MRYVVWKDAAFPMPVSEVLVVEVTDDRVDEFYEITQTGDVGAIRRLTSAFTTRELTAELDCLFIDGSESCVHGYEPSQCFPHSVHADASDQSIFPIDFGGGPGAHDPEVLAAIARARS